MEAKLKISVPDRLPVSMSHLLSMFQIGAARSRISNCVFGKWGCLAHHILKTCPHGVRMLNLGRCFDRISVN